MTQREPTAVLPVHVRDSSHGAPIYVVSDLHIGEGLRNGVFGGTENFFADAAFARALDSFDEPDAVLVLNGDIIDFLRMLRIPLSRDKKGELWGEPAQRTDDFAVWWALLCGLRGDSLDTPVVAADITIDDDDRRYGLHSEETKSAWKLYAARFGHQPFFAALARWVASGRRLFLTRGNHDIEWHWPLVRRCLLWILAEELAEGRHVFIQAGRLGFDRAAYDETVARVGAKLAEIEARVVFSAQKITFDGRVYIEHGNAYDRYSRVDGSPEVGSGPRKKLRLPVGSQFNRLLINQLELEFPWVDNVRPRENVLPRLMRERTGKALRLAFIDLPRLVGRLPWSYLKDLLAFALVTAIPLVALAIYLFTRPSDPSSSTLGDVATTAIQTCAAFAASALLPRLLTHFGLTEPTELFEHARRCVQRENAAPAARAGRENDKSARAAKLDIVTFGHTHDPDVVIEDDVRYFNTGTWIPIVETSATSLRTDRSYTFLKVTERGGRAWGDLLRWNDDARRSEALPVVQRPRTRGERRIERKARKVIASASEPVKSMPPEAHLEDPLAVLPAPDVVSAAGFASPLHHTSDHDDAP